MRWHLDRARERGEVLPIGPPPSATPEEFEEWRQEILSQSWVVALKGFAEQTRIWTGTGQQLMKELKLRAGREASESDEFPADIRTLLDYTTIALFALWDEELCVFDYRDFVEENGDFKKENLEEFDLPGWGPEAPILVEKDSAARRPSYHEAIFNVLLRHRRPLPLAALRFTYHSGKFRKNKRQWTGSTTELAGWLRAYYPGFKDNYPRDPIQAANKDHLHRYDETREMLELMTSSDYSRFYGQMKTCARILEEVGIRVTRTKLEGPRSASGQRKAKTRWLVEAPYWQRP